MNHKPTSWESIYKDFKTRHPTLSKKVIHWCPRSYATIYIKLSDGIELEYNYDIHTAKIIKEK